ncbi:hypothetical protein, partial [Halorubrum sp. SP9]|uniref:hypothetical protein n=1 Tax=Halorubrum sp. SP9 TaxID=1537267 RepID=UPI001A7E0DBA
LRTLVVLRRPPACPAGVIDSDGEFLLKITHPVIHLDKRLTSCGFRIYFGVLVTELINEATDRFSELDLAS